MRNALKLEKEKPAATTGTSGLGTTTIATGTTTASTAAATTATAMTAATMTTAADESAEDTGDSKGAAVVAMPKLNNWEEWPNQLKEQLKTSDNDIPLNYMLDYLKTLEMLIQIRLYQCLRKDTELLLLLCDRILEISEAKQNEAICEWLHYCLGEEFQDTDKDDEKVFLLFVVVVVVVVVYICVCIIATDKEHTNSAMDCLLFQTDVWEGQTNDENSHTNHICSVKLFAVQLVPVLVWCVYSRDVRYVGGIAAILLSLYKREKQCCLAQQHTMALSHKHQTPGITVFSPFFLPDLNFPSIFHCPHNYLTTPRKAWIDDDTVVHQNEAVIHPSHIPIPSLLSNRDLQDIFDTQHLIPAVTSTTTTTAGNITSVASTHRASSAHTDSKSNLAVKHVSIPLHKQRDGGKSHEFYMDVMATTPKVASGSTPGEKGDNKDKDKKDENDLFAFHFPLLQQGNLHTNLQLIHVALQLFNSYISKMDHVVLEQYCAIIAKICSSGMDASVRNDFPQPIERSLLYCKNWKWYPTAPNNSYKKRFIIPSEILCQFLVGLRYALFCELFLLCVCVFFNYKKNFLIQHFFSPSSVHPIATLIKLN
ncbi:hypothetical protein RFI_11785 [Reticulomyxa filosa]|uniref:Uncharacterized protein n=1 Tax=Reticulomyxa filosa TaxID=46433 RepID=X6NHI8_RETFI|nr:hypothetical protein RFI_11785 [Reticulomyxa filosa]|eukprot:ETO25353.1 hypothetical protein RFI_11785 [Reticulomyxa filosa]